MRTICRFVAVATAIVAVPVLGAAQSRGGALLNNVTVRDLVARGEPGDQARLSAHFAALEQRYAAEAKKHTAMAGSYGVNANRGINTGMSLHCRQLAELNTRSAATLGELAAYHQKLASGTPAAAPNGAERFQGGAGAPEPTEPELTALAAKASTPADHRGLGEYFATLAKRYTGEAETHQTLAQSYRGTRIAQAAVHHDRLAALARDEAKEATAAAAMHTQLAGIGK